MQRLELKATHKPVQNYYAALRQFDDLTYPGDNILFQTPRRALQFQNDTPDSPKQRYAQPDWSWTHLDSRGTI